MLSLVVPSRVGRRRSLLDLMLALAICSCLLYHLFIRRFSSSKVVDGNVVLSEQIRRRRIAWL